MTRLAELTSPEVSRQAAGAVLVLPLGSTEQHGPHLPLSTDTDLAVELCRRLAAARPSAVLAPPIAYGSSGEHRGFAGTLSIGQAALELLLVEFGRSATETFDRVLVVSAHGGNAEPLQRAVSVLRSESRDVRSWMPRWDGDPHAGRTETSLQLAMAPHRVREDRAEAGDTRPVRELLPLLRTSSVRAISPNGVLGDPAGANAAEGHSLLDTLATDLLSCFDSGWSPRETG